MTTLEFFKLLSDETRLLSLLLIIEEKELCVCELMQALDESQPKVSRHLAQMRKAGLLLDKRQGQWVFYRVNPELPDWINKTLAEISANNKALISGNITRLHQMGERPERVRACCN
ncbi:metalloregulator ArsR/SmtB family transcription factor [Shewanella psychropiezotolerans]|uniref:Metalloregulator ArsR/SmtB family transcription factor n=1 Tax=Shewanella psychropiezotolerans TaxID=2593655 RepID=A0ABX5WTL7_9GAMM|nr:MULTISPECIES: metalloregulator ArsR/SmtB family transcription factor [Shewanella]MPY25909.1 metalloregulator ArsR/SmtB family transcription factor [Shewanella sp. YLB-07]QDO82233.1 metalloregulator ArsR/SmtB family transcription factor [Shewanella psychropiezotolerans]